MCSGVISDFEKVAENDSDPYIMYPLKPGDMRFTVPDNEHKILTISSNEIIDMADGDPLIRFVMILPVEEFDMYLKA